MYTFVPHLQMAEFVSLSDDFDCLENLKWIDKFILYLPIWITQSKQGYPRSCIISRLVPILMLASILLNLYCVAFIVEDLLSPDYAANLTEANASYSK